MSNSYDQRDRESVLRDFTSADEEVRRLAVERIAVALPPGERIEALIECLGDPSWRVRKAAVERIAAHPDMGDAVVALIQALADGENPGRRNAAVEALIGCGESAVPHLMEARGTDDSDARKLVVDALGGLGEARAIPALIETLDDPDPNVRAASADALGAIGGDAVVEPLLRAAARDDEDSLVRFSALHALAGLEAPVRARDLGAVLDDPVLRPAGLALLGRGDDEEGEEALCKALASHSRTSREAAIRSLLHLLSRLDGVASDALVARIRESAAASPSLAPSAIERLRGADLPTRLALVQFLGLLGVEEAVLPILLAGGDEALSQVSFGALESLGEVALRAIDAAWSELDSRSRRDACALFGRGGVESGADRLLASLDDPDPELRVAAASTIGRRRLPEALSLLVQRLEVASAEDDFDSEEEVGAMTAALIAVAKPESGVDPAITQRAVDLLEQSLNGSVENVRLAAVRALGRIGRREDAQRVTFLLKDPSARVRRAAVDALADLEPGSAAEPLRLALADEAPEVRIAAADALGASENAAVADDLERLARDEDPRVRAAAVRAVGLRLRGSGDTRPAEPAPDLFDAALTDEATVALAALAALCEVGGDAAVRASRALTRAEPEVLREAIRCVGAHGDADGLEPLLPLVSHPDWAVRADAIQTLADRGAVRAVPVILRRLETEQDEFVRGVILRGLQRLEE